MRKTPKNPYINTQPKCPIIIDRAYIDEYDYLVIANKSGTLIVCTSISYFTEALNKLDTKFFNDDFYSGLIRARAKVAKEGLAFNPIEDVINFLDESKKTMDSKLATANQDRIFNAITSAVSANGIFRVIGKNFNNDSQNM